MDNNQTNKKEKIFDIALLVTIAVTAVTILVMGVVIGSKSGDPIGDFMKHISGRETEEEETFPDDTVEDETTEEDTEDTEDVTSDADTSEEVTSAEADPAGTTEEDTSAPDTTKEKDTAKPAETTKPEETTKPAETTKPEETTKYTPLDPDESRPPRERYPVEVHGLDDIEYFADALFVGDSRTVGLASYAKIKGATYFARNSMTVFDMLSVKKVTTQGDKSMGLLDFLEGSSFKKIFILLGINEMGYSSSKVANKMKEDIDEIHRVLPGVKVIITANYHTTAAKDASSKSVNNSRIEKLNDAYAALTNGVDIFFADIEDVFDAPGTGCMAEGVSRDGIHLYAKKYGPWRDYLIQYAQY